VDYESEELAAEDIWLETGGENMPVWEPVIPTLDTGRMLDLGSPFDQVFLSENEEVEGVLIASEVQGLGVVEETPLADLGRVFSPVDFSLIRESPSSEEREIDSRRRPEPSFKPTEREVNDTIPISGQVVVDEETSVQAQPVTEASEVGKGTKKSKKKCIKNKGLIRNMALGEDVEIQEVVQMSKITLVGRVNGRSFALGTILKWVEEAWGFLGFLPEVVELSRKWYAFTFHSENHAQQVLRKNWSIQSSPILLKPWTPLFDASRERVDIVPLWVRMPAFPLQFWKEKYFRSVGNRLGEFLEADESFLETKQKRIARILVNINVREGLGDEIELVLGSYRHIQKLDYENIPFRCRRCHEYGHLVADCKLPLRIIKRKSPKEAAIPLSGIGTIQEAPVQELVGEAENVPNREDPEPSQEAGALVVKKGRPCRGGSHVKWTQATIPLVFPTGIPHSPSSSLSTLLQNLNLNIVNSRWIEPLNASLPESNSLVLKPMEVEDSPQEGPPQPEAGICEKPSRIEGTSGSSRYFLRSKTTPNPAGGLGVEGHEGGRGRGRKSYISKAKNKAKNDLLAGKQRSIEWALRARAQDMGP